MMWRLWIILPVFLVAALFLRFDMHPNPWAVTAVVTLGFFSLVSSYGAAHRAAMIQNWLLVRPTPSAGSE
jgi:hypothetical protein